MIKTAIRLIAFPDFEAKFERIDLKTLMTRALRVEDRMAKGVLLEDEQRRYHALCDRIEYYGNIIAQRAVADLTLGSDYFELLIEILVNDESGFRKARMGANFCPSEKIADQIRLMVELLGRSRFAKKPTLKQKLEFYRQALRNHWNVIELQEVVTVGDIYSELVNPNKLRQDFLTLKVAEGGALVENAYVGLRNQFRTAITAIRQDRPASINFSDLGHHVITEILHEFVYANYRQLMIPVMYSDGSIAPDFPINVLKPRDSQKVEAVLKNTPILNIGMMSQRHYEMDPIVKIYFFRNQEISTGKTAAETDITAYEKAKALFRSSRNEGIYRIAFYQTGFQPAVVGFYRALTEELIYRSKEPPTMQVIPYYFLHDKYVEGKIWM